LKRWFDDYDNNKKAYVDRCVDEITQGASFIDVADCCRIHQRMFNRDSKDDKDGEKWKLSLTFAHSGGNGVSVFIALIKMLKRPMRFMC